MCAKYYRNGIEMPPREYWTEDALILDYTEGIKDLVSPERYNLVFDMFKEKDMRGLALMVEGVLKESRRYALESDEKDRQIQNLKKRIEEAEIQISKLSEEKETVEKTAGKYRAADLEKMKQMYQNGQSLRNIGQEFNMDKSTVKRKLIQMGVEIRKK